MPSTPDPIPDHDLAEAEVIRHAIRWFDVRRTRGERWLPLAERGLFRAVRTLVSGEEAERSTRVALFYDGVPVLFFEAIPDDTAWLRPLRNHITWGEWHVDFFPLTGDLADTSLMLYEDHVAPVIPDFVLAEALESMIAPDQCRSMINEFRCELELGHEGDHVVHDDPNEPESQWQWTSRDETGEWMPPVVYAEPDEVERITEVLQNPEPEEFEQVDELPLQRTCPFCVGGIANGLTCRRCGGLAVMARCPACFGHGCDQCDWNGLVDITGGYGSTFREAAEGSQDAAEAPLTPAPAPRRPRRPRASRAAEEAVGQRGPHPTEVWLDEPVSPPDPEAVRLGFENLTDQERELLTAIDVGLTAPPGNHRRAAAEALAREHLTGDFAITAEQVRENAGMPLEVARCEAIFAEAGAEPRRCARYLGHTEPHRAGDMHWIDSPPIGIDQGAITNFVRNAEVAMRPIADAVGNFADSVVRAGATIDGLNITLEHGEVSEDLLAVLTGDTEPQTVQNSVDNPEPF